MLEIFSIFLREGMEMVLLLGIIISYLERTKRKRSLKHVYFGSAFAVIASILSGKVLYSLKAGFSPLVEAALFFVTAIFVLTLMLWFYYGSKHLTKGLGHRIEEAMSRWQNTGLFIITFLIIFREGAEIVLLMAALDRTQIFSAYIEAFIGIIIVLLLGYFIIKGGMKIDLRKFYRVTSIMLMIIIIELVFHGIFELIEGGMLHLGPAITELMELFIEGPGRLVFSGVLLVLISIVLVNIWSERDRRHQ